MGYKNTTYEIVKDLIESGYGARENDVLSHVNFIEEYLTTFRQQACPNLEPVINWLKNGCEVSEAIKELEIYQQIFYMKGIK